MPKSPLLYTGAESNLKDKVLDEVEEKIFINFPGKGRHWRTQALKKLCLLSQEDFVNFISLI